MHALAPEFEGRLAVARIPDDFFQGFAQRVKTGLFVPGVRVRAQYEVVRASRDAFAFRATDVSTAIGFGLNEVDLQRDGATTIRYRVRFGSGTSTWLRAQHSIIQGAAVATASPALRPVTKAHRKL